MADSVGFCKVAEWVQSDKDIKAVVVSAGGKTRVCKKVTDLLFFGAKQIEKGESVKKSLSPFVERAVFDAERIGVGDFIKEELMKIEQEVERDFSLDFLLSRGEFIYAKAFSKYFGIRFVDSKNLIGFYPDGRLNLGYSEFKISEEYLKGGRFVTGGFYGAYQNGKIKTFTRGGSDFSGSIVARGLNAKKYLNFTDVDGVYSIPPNFAKSQIVKEISFDQIRLLGEFGANVLHPASVIPLYGTGAEIDVKNTFNKHACGTRIFENCKDEPFAFSVCENCKFLSVQKRGYGHNILQDFSTEKVEILCSTASLDFAKICFKGEFDCEEFANKHEVSYFKSENVSVLFFTNNRRSFDIIYNLKKSKIASFIANFEKGAFVLVKNEDLCKVVEFLDEK